jgi:hypothetical protein
MSLPFKSPSTVLTCENSCSGDAYIVVVWLLSADVTDSTLDEEEIEFTNTNRCLDMLKVADGILTCLEEHRKKTGIDLHGRIGIATGDVISGVLGLLQPRFCVFGEGMCHAAELEQAGVKGSVHCSNEFLEFITGQHKSTTQRNASFSAELRFEVSKSIKVSSPCKSALIRRKSAAVVRRMEEQGRLLREQKSMTAAPAASRGEFNPIPPVPRFSPSIDTGTFGLATSINKDGNFPQFNTRPYHEQYLSRSMDEYGTLLVMRGMPVMRGTWSTVRSKLDCSTSVPKLLQHESDQVLPGSTSVPKLLQHESDQVLPNQVLPDENTVTHVEHLLRPIVETTANNVDRQASPGFDEIVPS